MPEKTVFGTFFGFFLGRKSFFSPTFLKFFSGSLKFSRAHFRIFSRGDFFFLGQKFRIFLGHIFFFLGHNFLTGRKIFYGLMAVSLVFFCKIPTGSEL